MVLVASDIDWKTNQRESNKNEAHENHVVCKVILETSAYSSHTQPFHPKRWYVVCMAWLIHTYCGGGFLSCIAFRFCFASLVSFTRRKTKAINLVNQTMSRSSVLRLQEKLNKDNKNEWSKRCHRNEKETRMPEAMDAIFSIDSLSRGLWLQLFLWKWQLVI